jgi:hypothetical protein
MKMWKWQVTRSWLFLTPESLACCEGFFSVLLTILACCERFLACRMKLIHCPGIKCMWWALRSFLFNYFTCQATCNAETVTKKCITQKSLATYLLKTCFLPTSIISLDI